MDDVRVAKELVSVARELAALGNGPEVGVDQEAVDQLTAKFVSRLGPAKSKQLRTYGLEVRGTDTVEGLARAWATVLLS
jgi:hypothetical protein